MGGVESIPAEFWDNYGSGLIDFVLKLVIAGLIIWLGGKAIKRLKRFLKQVISKASALDPTIIGFLVSVLGAVLNFFLFLIALEQVGIDNTTFVAASGAAFFALALAMEGSLENFAAGFMLLTFKPFKVGDYVMVAGETGHVQVLELFNTTLLSDEGAIIICPNGSVLGDNITNYSAKSSLRVEVEFQIPYGGDVDAARELLEDAIFEDARILKDPEPEVFLKSFDNELVTLAAEVWVDPHDQRLIAFYLKEAVKPRFDEAGFSLDQGGDDSDDDLPKRRKSASNSAHPSPMPFDNGHSPHIGGLATPAMVLRRPRLTRGPLHLTASGYLVRTNHPKPKKKILDSTDELLNMDMPIVPTDRLLWFSIEHGKLTFWFMKDMSPDSALGSVPLALVLDCQPSVLDVPADSLKPEAHEHKSPGHLSGQAAAALVQMKLDQKKKKEMSKLSKSKPAAPSDVSSRNLLEPSANREPDYGGLSAQRLMSSGFILNLRNPKDPVWNMRIPEGEETHAATWIDIMLAAARLAYRKERKRREAEGV